MGSVGVTRSRLPVLVVEHIRSPENPLCAWLAEQEGLDVRGGFASLAAAIGAATLFHPRVVLLSFHGLPVSIGYAVTLFKELLPTPLVFVLTHEPSETMRRRCLQQADGVFDKTLELHALLSRLSALTPAPPPAAAPGLLPGNRVFPP